MEVEVKFPLPDSLSHQKLSGFLSPFHIKPTSKKTSSSTAPIPNSPPTSPSSASSSTTSIPDASSLSRISSGISRLEEDEEPIDPSIGLACVAEPWRLLSVNSSRIVKRVRGIWNWRKGFGLFRRV